MTILTGRNRPSDLPAGFDALTFKVPSDSAVLDAGVYGVSAHVTTDDELGKNRTYPSNEVLMSIAPRIAKMSPVSVKADKKAVLKIQCDPKPANGTASATPRRHARIQADDDSGGGPDFFRGVAHRRRPHRSASRGWR